MSLLDLLVVHSNYTHENYARSTTEGKMPKSNR